MVGRLVSILCIALLTVATAAPHAVRASWEDTPPKYDFQLDDLKLRGDVQMQQLRDKPLVVHVWAPDCPHCERNMPYVKSTFEKIDKASVNFVGCSMGQQRETADYVRQHELPFSVLYKGHAEDYISEAFTSDGWPTSFVFAPGGELIGSCDAQGVEYEKRMLELIDAALAKVKPKTPPKKVKHW